jgi:hypothetical protein
MKENGEYAANGYEILLNYAKEIGLSYFDGHEMFVKMREEGEQVFTKGGVHWSGIAVVPYFNALVDLLNTKLNQPVGTVQMKNVQYVLGEPYITDGDIADTINYLGILRTENIPAAFNGILSALKIQDKKLFEDSLKSIFTCYNFYSPHVETVMRPAAFRPNLFAIGGSFNWTWLSMVYEVRDWNNSGSEPIFNETDFSYYNGYITRFPEDKRIAEKTDDFNLVLDKDIILVEFNEQTCLSGAVQFIFAENLFQFLNEYQESQAED